MHLSRSEKSKAEKKARKQRTGRVWIMLNLCLIFMIAALLVYHFKFKEDPVQQTAYPPGMPDFGMEGDQADSPGSGQQADGEGADSKPPKTTETGEPQVPIGPSQKAAQQMILPIPRWQSGWLCILQGIPCSRARWRLS